ncbi:hypothetical protein TNCT_399731, partial [Trichonephila clavata]
NRCVDVNAKEIFPSDGKDSNPAVKEQHCVSILPWLVFSCFTQEMRTPSPSTTFFIQKVHRCPGIESGMCVLENRIPCPTSPTRKLIIR